MIPNNKSPAQRQREAAEQSLALARREEQHFTDLLARVAEVRLSYTWSGPALAHLGEQEKIAKAGLEKAQQLNCAAQDQLSLLFKKESQLNAVVERSAEAIKETDRAIAYRKMKRRELAAGNEEKRK